MFRLPAFWFVVLLLLAGCRAVDPEANNPTEQSDPIRSHTLTNSTLLFQLTPDLGGRGLFFGLLESDNVLKTGRAVMDHPDPAIRPDGPNIPYYGHIVWAGPQSQWWLNQSFSPQRARTGAQWPPDPYTVLAKNRYLEKTLSEVTIESPDSPVTGLRLTKTFRLNESDPHRLDLHTVATNIRSEPVSTDIWYNTRVSTQTRAYVPVAGADAARVAHFSGDPLTAQGRLLEEGVFAFDLKGVNRTEGKAFIQPSAGWIASFTEDQLFIIEFSLLPESSIHPEQGQVELYLKYDYADESFGVQELELHGTFRELQPGEQMSLGETWRVYPWRGKATMAQEVAELKRRGYLD